MGKWLSKVTYNLDLTKALEEIPRNKRTIAKNEIGTYIIEQILSDVSQSKSPVTGRGFAALSKDYAKEKKKISSSVRANLELHGRMLDALTFKNKANSIEIGIFDSNQAPKADNHCKFSPESKATKVPARKFIPTSEEKFRPAIRNEISKIISEFIED